MKRERMIGYAEKQATHPWSGDEGDNANTEERPREPQALQALTESPAY